MAQTDPSPTFRNLVLQQLTPEIIGRLDLRSINLPVDASLKEPGEVIADIVFLERGVGSMTTKFLDGSQAEVGLFGSESIVGTSA